MRIHVTEHALLAAALCLHAMRCPPDRTVMSAALAAAAFLVAVPLGIGILLRQNLRIRWACLSMICSPPQLFLPLTAILMPFDSAAMTFMMVYWLMSRISAGYLLRSTGAAAEKNFALIAAYTQTCRHACAFPNECRPENSPLFASARRAQHALISTLPWVGWCIGIIANAVGFVGWVAFVPDFCWNLAISVCATGSMLLALPQARKQHFPIYRPDSFFFLAVFVRFLYLPASVYCVLRSVFPAEIFTDSYHLLLALPPAAALIREWPEDGNMIARIEDTACWMRILWLVWLLVFILI